MPGGFAISLALEMIPLVREKFGIPQWIPGNIHLRPDRDLAIVPLHIG